MNLFGMIDHSGGAMQAERMRAEVVAANMANAETTRTAAGTPYHRQHIVFSAGPTVESFSQQMGNLMPAGGVGSGAGAIAGSTYEALRSSAVGAPAGEAKVAPGVHVAAVVEDTAPPLKRYDPGHPDADAEGYVAYPDINPLTEMVDLMGATRAYGLNASAVQAEKSMVASAIEIVK